MPSYKKNLLLAFTSICCIFYFSCQKELKGDFPDPVEPPVNDEQKVTASVQGYVTDENDLPLEGAAITSGAQTTTTDKNGVFRFNNIQLSKNNGYVKISKNGYFTGSRSFVTNAGRVNHIRVQLIKKTIAGTIDASAGGSVTLLNGVKITLPGAAVINATNNQAYSGTVNIAAAWIDPSANNLTSQMPGDLRGILATGQERGLQTFGMIGVELIGSGREALQIATGKKAGLTFPIPASLQGFAPPTIALWHFDEVAGRWKEDGTATKTGNNYVGEVSHFSFWNCDAPFPVVNFSATILNADKKPVYTLVRIKKIENNSAGHGRTDSSGFVSGKIPANELLILEVLDPCQNVIFSKNIGPFSADAELGTITVTNSQSLITITGTLTDCNNANVTNGYVQINMNNSVYRANVSNGAFSFSITNCSSNNTFKLFGVDLATTQQNTAQQFTLNSSPFNAGTIQACGISATQSVSYTINSGTPTLLTSPPDSISFYRSGANSAQASVSAFNTATYKGINFSFNDIGAAGSAKLNYISVSTLDSSIINTANPVVNITQYGAIGGFVEGNLNVQLKKSTDNSLHTVICNFKVRRNQ